MFCVSKTCAYVTVFSQQPCLHLVCDCIRHTLTLTQPRVVSDLLEPLVATGDNDVTINVAWALHHLGRAPVNLAPLLSGACMCVVECWSWSQEMWGGE